ncbi:MAG TPA: 4-hydroxy-tetrahydrodipicolinate reductase [Longimicrobiales bacterium]|nr:4-hydroxy-tetrahydrodipicolinate reductase [Longimicrobiales bacterium]
MALDLVVSGATGRMGRALAGLMEDAEDLRALGGIAPSGPEVDPAGSGYPEIVPPDACGELIRRADVLIDFSAPTQLAEILDRHGDTLDGTALVVGTTGLEAGHHERLRAAAERVPVLVAANFSVGVNLLLGLVERAAGALDGDAYDIEIVEAHHRRKEDAPSGTALALGEAAARGRGQDLSDLRTDGRSGRTGARPEGEIAFHALRGGGEPGEHVVHFLGERERISLSHRAAGRELFAEGALVAARWLAGRDAGEYRMTDVLGLR